ncbi:MAG: ABC transporter ATP-binding protein, partial [Candidatus Magasanikbacteria bacterium]|nr:ABC transporter ATP-binding protein [Candidatus Magasanikbacteria bacterium]
MKLNTKTTLKLFLKSNAHYPWLFAFILIGIVGATFAEAIGPLFYKDFFDKMTQDLTITNPQSLVHILIYILLINLGGQMFWRLAIISASLSESKVIADLSNFCFRALHRHSFSFFNNNFVGSLTKKVNRFTRSYEGIVDRFYWDFIPLFLGVGIILFVLFSRNFWLGLILVAWCILFITLNFLFLKFKYKYDLKRSELDSKVTGLLADTITNNANIKLLCGTERETAAFADLNEQLRRIRSFVWTMGSIFQGLQGFLMVTLEIGIFYLAIGLKQQGILTLGDFVLIQTYLIQIFSKIWNFGHTLQKVYEDLAEAEEMAEIINLPTEINDQEKATALKVTQGLIEFKNVIFKYNNKTTILNKFDLTINPGQRFALVGPSGAGKTTVIKLLLRMHELEGGQILIDGQNITEVTQESLHQ